MTKDIPIIFSAPMIRALLEGRKTMTRRILKPQPIPFMIDDGLCDVAPFQIEGEPRQRVALGRVITAQKVRYAPGDRLWVRENLVPSSCGFDYDAGPNDACIGLSDLTEDQIDFWGNRVDLDPDNAPKVPSIHMPRWASRLTLIVSAIKIERLHEISNADVIAEGITEDQIRPWREWLHPDDCAAHTFGLLWAQIHGTESWDANPFVVAITFRIIKANIDAPEAGIAA